MKFLEIGLNLKKIIHNPIIMTILIAVLIFIIFFAFDIRLSIKKYTIESSPINSAIKIALITDLHSCYYGKNQVTLVRALEEQNPDIVLLGGDIFDDKIDDKNTEIFLKAIHNKYPCYYVTGNHEYWSGEANFNAKMGILKKYGIKILSNEFKTITVNGEKINICGADDPYSYIITENMNNSYFDELNNFEENISALSKASENENFTLLLSHQPELFDIYTKYGFDLVLCGHAHGGQWRIPFILNGVYAPNQGIFPQYAGGRYEKDGTVMIVSRGLARETTYVPRIFNRPELVIIDLK